VSDALDKKDIGAIFWAIAAMFIVIIMYDQLLFRPLVAWSSKFRFEVVAGATAEDPWLLRLLRRTIVLHTMVDTVGGAFSSVTRLRLALPGRAPGAAAPPPSLMGDAVFFAIVAVVAVVALWKIVSFVTAAHVGWSDLAETMGLGAITLTRVMILIALASAFWVPIGVWIGLRPAWARRIQALAQFVAAFPANLLFPIFVVLIVRFHLNPDIWLTPLMILGTQWYILFNVIAGASAFPGDLQEAAKNFRVGGWLWWRRVILPGVFPYYVTGAITASGGSWNAAIVAEVASWGDTKLSAHGLGAYIAHQTDAGDFPRVVLGVAVMSLYVLTINKALWRPLFTYATRRLTL
jgi:NitT/TauT family transport system permease protein